MIGYIGFGLIAVGIVWLIAYVIKNLSTLIPSIPSQVTTVATKVDDYADIVAGISACFAITAIAKKRGNADLAKKVAEVRIAIAGLADDTVVK